MTLLQKEDSYRDSSSDHDDEICTEDCPLVDHETGVQLEAEMGVHPAVGNHGNLETAGTSSTHQKYSKPRALSATALPTATLEHVRRLSARHMSDEASQQLIAHSLGLGLTTMMDRSGSDRTFPIGFIGSNGRNLSVHPITKSSIGKLFLDPGRQDSVIGFSRVRAASSRSIMNMNMDEYSYKEVGGGRRMTLTDYKALQEMGDKVLMLDYQVINASLAYVLVTIIAGIIFFACWKGAEWVMFMMVGVIVLLITSAFAIIKIHFYLKARRQARQYIRHRRDTMQASQLGLLSPTDQIV